MKNLSSTTVIIVAVVIGVVFLLLVSNASRSELEPEQQSVELPILLEEFSDFQCPACGSFFPVVQTIKGEYGDKLDFVYKHFPLESIHENAFAAAVASEAAREQGKFEEYHDLLFADQEALGSDNLLSYAKELGLDIDRFKADLKNEDVIARVNADITEGNQRGVNATPTFYLEGEKMVFPGGISPVEQFRTLIDELIERAEFDNEADSDDAGSSSDTSDDTQAEVGEEESREEEDNGDDQKSDSVTP